MRKTLCILLVMALVCACLPAFAATTLECGDELYIYSNSLMYDSYNRYTRNIVTFVPSGSIVIYIGTIDWGICVAYGNAVGYLENPSYRKTYSWESFVMPDGSGYVPGWGAVTPTPTPTPTPRPTPTPTKKPTATPYVDHRTLVPEFPFSGIYAEITDGRLATRSGPGPTYTWTDYHPQYADTRVFYQTMGDGVAWGYFEMVYEGQKYWLYAGLSHANTNQYVPKIVEDYVRVDIVKKHRPHYGPGNDYMAATYEIYGGATVKAFYQMNGWLLYETTAPNGAKQRAWAPPEAWN